MTLWALFCRWRWARAQNAASRWERRYRAMRAALEAKWTP